MVTNPVADLRGARGTRVPLGVQILSISCSFWENLAKSYVGTPPGVGAPPRGNPGSATAITVVSILWLKSVPTLLKFRIPYFE